MPLENAFPAIIFSKFSGGGPFASRLRRRLRATGGPPAAEPSLVGKHARAPPQIDFTPYVYVCKGLVSATFRQAFITPVPKKPRLDATSASSYRSMSNLSVLSKLLEYLVARQLMEYLSLIDLLPPLWFSTGSFYTAVLQVLSDILQAVDRGDLAALVLLDLSAAFDTLDHSILLECLRQTFGIGDTALRWFQSYLSSRKQYVRRGPNMSSVIYLVCGVPQGSVHFVLYNVDLLEVIDSY